MKMHFLRRYMTCYLMIQFSVLYSQGTRDLDAWIHSQDSVVFSVLVQNTAGDVLYEYHSQRSVIAASIIKISIMQVLFDRFGIGDGLLAREEYLLESHDIVGGAGSLQFEPPGKKFSLSQLSRKMIAESDNTATNVIISKCGVENINAWLKHHGYSHTQLNRKMMDLDAIQKGIQNRTTATEMNAQLLQIYNDARRGSRNACAMLSMLQECDDTAVIPAGLPLGTVIAHKSGVLDGMRADAGIIFLNKPLIISIFVKGCRSQSSAESMIAALTARIIRLFSK